MSAYTDRVDARTVGDGAPYKFASFGLDAPCESCQRDRASYLSANYGASPGELTEKQLADFSDDIEQGWCRESVEESHRECPLCDSELFGNRYAMHYIDVDGNYRHGLACADCRIYISNGEEPEQWP